MLRPLVPVVLSCVLGACASVLGLEHVDYTSDPADASSSSGDPSRDADTGFGDGGAREGGPKPLVDAGQPAACAATFCDDFERDDLQGPWARADTNGAALFMPDDLRIFAGQRSLRVALVGASFEGTGPFLQRTFPAPASSVKLDLAFYGLVLNRDVHLVDLVFSGGGTLFIGVTAGKVVFGEESSVGAVVETPIATLVVNGWQELSLVLTLGTNPTANARIGSAVLARSVGINPGGAPFDLKLGVPSSSSGGAIEVGFDNLSLLVIP